jgi:hypothetical protein
VAAINGHGSIGIGGDGFALSAGMHTVRAGYHNAATWEGVTVHDSAGDTTITPHFR